MNGLDLDKNNPVLFVGAGPGDPELITVAGRRAVEAADVIVYAGSLVSEEMLGWNAKGAEMVDSAPLHLDQIVEILIEGQRQGKKVVRLHTGDPGLYGAIQEQIDRLEAEDIPYLVIPGVTAAFATAAALGREMTLPEVTQTVILTRMSGRTSVPQKEALDSLAAHGCSMAIYLSTARIESAVEVLSRSYGPDTGVVVGYRVSWPDQNILHGTLKTIADKVKAAGIDRHAVIMVGPAFSNIGEPIRHRSKLYDKQFSHAHRDGRD